MTKPAISVRGLGKQYRIGARQEKYQTLRERIAGAFRWKVAELQSDRVAGSSARQVGSGSANPEPRTKNQEPGTNSATQQPNNLTTSRTDLFWALKDVTFDIQPGEVVGVIGRNGAGKSTLLKILTQITYPTEGEVEIRGRVASLLEVGTGFHPELTGRENIFLNGAILGMKRAEIVQKFDEIVAFAEVDKFIDTPVKRYSSGMYVRLAFAVAAHLEPEILLVDEVLAVGDIQFQKKCLGKMGDVAKSGRTVMFVSHNMAAVESLCLKSLLLAEGRLMREGKTEDVIGVYMATDGLAAYDVDLRQSPNRVHGMDPIVRHLRIADRAGRTLQTVALGEDVVFEMELEREIRMNNVAIGLHVYSAVGQRVATCHTGYQHAELIRISGRATVRCIWKRWSFLPGSYSVVLGVANGKDQVDRLDPAITFEVTSRDLYGTGRIPAARDGLIAPDAEWTVS